MKRIFITLTAFAITASAQVTLEIMQTENSSFSIQTNIKLDQILQLAGQEIATQNSQTFTTEHTTDVRGKGGTLRATVTIKPWVSKWVFPGGITMEFNSATPDTKAPLPQYEPILDLLRVMTKHSSTYVYNKDNSIKIVELPKATLNDVPKQLKHEFSAKNLTEQLKQEQSRLPNKAVSKGDTWVRTETMKLGGNQVITFQIDYKYEGTVIKNTNELHRITGQVTDVTYEMKDNDTAPLKVKNSQLKAAKTKIEILFDKKRGKFVQSVNLIQITGNMTFEANGQELPGQLDLTISQNNIELPKEKK